MSVCPTVPPSGNIWSFVKGDLADKPLIDRLFTEHHFDIVVNLAAQPGARYSIDNPLSLYAATKKSNELFAQRYKEYYIIIEL